MVESQSRVEKSYSYDEMDRLISVTYEDGKQVVYSYDAAGNRTKVSLLSAGEKSVVTPKQLEGTFSPPPPLQPPPQRAQQPMSQPATQAACPICHTSVEPGALFCHRCGAPRVAPPQPPRPFCPSCGHRFDS